MNEVRPSTTGPDSARGRAGAERWVRREGSGDSADIDGFELGSARRALALLKLRLGRERILELIADELAAGEAFLRDGLVRSLGEELSGTVTLRARGIGAAAFGGWMGRAFSREDVLLAAHPEHYSIHAEPGALVNIVETLGDRVCSFYMREWDGGGQGGAGPAVRRSQMELADGTVIGTIVTEFEDDPGPEGEAGFAARLSVTLPSACGKPTVDQHLEHFSVEFRNWITAAMEELAAG